MSLDPFCLELQPPEDNCNDDAPAEFFWRRLEPKLLDGGSLPVLAEAGTPGK